jgi:hypothetical protein
MKRILLIGVGRWGVNHLRVLKSLPIELFAADHDGQRIGSVDIPQSRRSTDARSLFSEVDAAVVATPAQTHFETCRELLEMGKDVFVEKPITLASEAFTQQKNQRTCRRCLRRVRMRIAFAGRAPQREVKATSGFASLHRTSPIGCATKCRGKISATPAALIACSNANASCT